MCVSVCALALTAVFAPFAVPPTMCLSAFYPTLISEIHKKLHKRSIRNYIRNYISMCVRSCLLELLLLLLPFLLLQLLLLLRVLVDGGCPSELCSGLEEPKVCMGEARRAQERCVAHRCGYDLCANMCETKVLRTSNSKTHKT